MGKSTHSKVILNRIQQAHEAQQSGAVDKLYDAADMSYEKDYIADDLTNHFKSNSSVDDIHHNINRIYL